MSDLVEHVLLFGAASLVIVVMSAFYSEPEDGPALRSVPRRYLRFVLACGVVAAIMLFCEHWFASVE